ncbi:MAG TPA: GFA family protein [Steroidobacteraceae bacterium]|nr:GFA family protein [Steroidobacteraceae bacterium]
MSVAITGRCFCGKVRYAIGSELTNLCYCHCESCRRAVGSPFVAWGTAELKGFAITRGTLHVIDSSADVRRGFCADCGSSLTYQHAGRPNEIDITLATLDDPATQAPRVHIWVRDKLPWVTLSDGLPRYETVPS